MVALIVVAPGETVDYRKTTSRSSIQMMGWVLTIIYDESSAGVE